MISAPNDNKLKLLRIISLVTAVAGAVGAVCLTLKAGQRNNSILLKGFFLIWVLSPFIVIVIANILSNRLSFASRLRLYILTVAIAIGSVIGYTGILNPAGTKNAFIFLFIPVLTWLLIAVAYIITRRSQGRR